MFLFDIVKSGNFQVFQQVIGNDLSIRDDNNQCLIARICGRRMSQMLHYVMALPQIRLPKHKVHAIGDVHGVCCALTVQQVDQNSHH
jgi:hypothetical protein